MNTKRDRFTRLAEKRVTNAVIYIRRIANLSNKSLYEYSGDEVRQILSQLRKEVTALEDKMKSDNSSGSYHFKLNSKNI